MRIFLNRVTQVYYSVVPYIGVSVLVAGLTGIILYPVIAKFSRIMPGEGDVFTYAWSLWWFMYAIVYLRRSPFVTNYQFYPLEVNISQDISLIHGALSLPITFLWGPIAGYNFIIFFTFVITGLGFYLFINLITKDRLASLFGTLIFTFSYNRTFRSFMGHLDIASTEWVGFVLYFLFQVFVYRRNTKGNIVGAAVFLALTAYTEYRNFLYMVVFAVVFIVVSSSAHVFTHPTKNIKGALGVVVDSFVKLFLVLYVCIIPIVLLNLSKIGDIQYAPTYQDFNADPLSLLFLPCNVLLSHLMQQCYSSPTFEGSAVYLGVAPVILLLLYVFIRFESKNRILFYSLGATTLTFLVLSLGTKTILYRFLFDYLPFFKIIRVPSRLIMLTEIGVAAFAALGLRSLLMRINSRVLRWIMVLGVLVVSLSESVFTNITYVNDEKIPSQHLGVYSPSYDAAMLDIPFGFRGNVYETLGSHNTAMSFYYQMKHHMPIIGGYMSMIDGKTWMSVRKDSLLEKLIACQEEKRCMQITDDERSRFINVYKIKYVTFLSRQYPHMEQYLLKEFTLNQLYEKGEISVWENSDMQ